MHTSTEMRNFRLFCSSHAYPEDSWDTDTLFPLACAWVASQGCVLIWQEPFPLFRIWDISWSWSKIFPSNPDLCEILVLLLW